MIERKDLTIEKRPPRRNADEPDPNTLPDLKRFPRLIVTRSSPTCRLWGSAGRMRMGLPEIGGITTRALFPFPGREGSRRCRSGSELA